MTQLPSQSDHNDPWGGAGTDAFSTPGTEPAGFSAAGYGHTYGGGMDDADGGAVHYLQVLYRRRYLAASTFLAVFLGVALYTFTAVRIYESSVRILIERDNPNVVSFQEVLDQSEITDDYYETQYKILQSRALARRTMDALELWKHPQFAQPSRMTLRSLLMMPINAAARWFEPALPPESPDTAETRAQTSAIDRFLRNLEIAPVRYSRLVDITFSSPDPGLASKVANTLADAYIRQSVELRSSTTKEASKFLTQQLAEQRQKLESSERALQAYREQTGSVSLEERQNVVVQRLADLNAALTRTATSRIQKDAAYNQFREALSNPSAIDSLPAVLSNQFVQQQKAELAQLQRQRAQLSEKLGPNHPDMVKIGLAIDTAEAKIEAEVAQISEAMRSEYEAALAEERTLAAELNSQKQEAQVLNRAGISYGALQRDAAANRQMFEALLQRTQETGVSEEIRAANIRVVDPAEIPTAPISPNLFNNILMGLLGGLTLAIGLAFGLEYVDDRIKSPDELKKHLGLPFLGMVPALARGKASSPVLDQAAPGVYSESFRAIRTNVLFSSTDQGSRLIVVTSSAPGEGKTVVSSNIAIALAQAGHRVLLLDADMRKPRVHDVFRTSADPGLSNVLVGDATPIQATRESSTSGLWIMPAGTPPPNPAELLGSKRFRDFSALAMQSFDWIIVDTPPVMAVTDAAVAANVAHGVLFVVGADMTSRRVAQSAVEQLELSQAKFLGTVLNRVDLEGQGYYYSHYYRPEYAGYYGQPRQSSHAGAMTVGGGIETPASTGA